jgi:RNA polymerase sigma factor (sigma-70 family)
MHADTTDPDLVAQALAGDRAALAAIYDRYADRVHDLCRHMLGDADEAADVCAQVFLVAFSRLGQLRDPERLRSWLFAIARHEVYRRSRQRSRTRLVEGVEQMDRLMAEQVQAGVATSDDDDQVDVAALVAVLRAAADGLDDRDRMVMELQLQGLDGDELAAALGTSVSTGYQQVHRMKERLERSVGALLVARQGRSECDELDRLLSGWDGTFSVLWRKRVARHVDRCEVCERRRSAIPAALFGTAAAVPMVPVSAVGAAPAAVRDRVLAEARVGSVSGGRGWRSDGFPVAEPGPRRPAVLAVAAVVLLVLAIVGLVALAGDDGDDLAAIDAVASTTTAAPTTTASTTTTAAPAAPATPASTEAPPPPPSTTAPAPTTTVAPTAPAPPSPTVTTTVEPGPQVELQSVPRVLYHPTPGFGSCGASTEVVAVAGSAAVRVELWWRDPSGADGTVSMTPNAGEWRGVVELPEQLAGPATLLAVAYDAQGRTGVSATASVPVRACPTPG